MIREFITSNFNEAIKIQSGFDHDLKMVNAIKQGLLTSEMTLAWMRNYGLFQGIKSETREKIASEYIKFTKLNKNIEYMDISVKFQELHQVLKSIETRKWLSATSKLLWCIQPEKVVIYDAFVARAILVLQCLDEELAKFPRIGSPPDARKDVSSIKMTKYYMNYQDLVEYLYEKNRDLIQELKFHSGTKYQYDIRIIDKLLWIMGNFNIGFELNQTNCKLEK